MPRMQSPILGGAYESRSLLLNAQRRVNLYAETVETKDGKTTGALYGCPGLVLLYEDEYGPWRTLHQTGRGAVLGVKGRTLHQVTGSYSLANIGLLNTDSGPVSIVDNGNQVLVVDGDKAYGYDEAANRFELIALPFVTGAPIVCAFQDGFFLLNQTNTAQWWQSDLNDVFTWDGLNFSSKDGQADPVVTMVDNHREVWLLGTLTSEVWINAGNPGFAFQRLQGVFLQEGCVAPHSAKVVGEALIWLAQSREGRGMVVMSGGEGGRYSVRRVSTHAIDRAIQSYSRIEDAIAYVYQQEGHQFYVLTFPSADVTWCYDLTTGLWHERASFVTGFFHRHRANCCAVYRGQVIVGDYENGNLYAFDLDSNTDAGETRKWLCSWPARGPNQITLKNDTFDRLEIYMEPGVGVDMPSMVRSLDDTDYPRALDNTQYVRVLSGNSTPQMETYENPQVMLRWSDTGGRSWGNEHWQPIGKIGELKRRIVWNRLGSARDRVFELSATDPCKAAIVGAFLDVTPGVT